MPLLLLSNTEKQNKSAEEHFLTDKKIKKAAYFASQADPERKFFNLAKEHYHQFNIEEWLFVDLDREFDEKSLMAAFECDLIHLTGGSTPYFYHNILRRGAETQIRSYYEKGGNIVGVSAGAILLGPSLAINFDLETEKAVAKKYELEKTIGIYNFEFYPHYKGTNSQNNFLAQRFQQTKIPIAACPDGSGIIWDEGKSKTLGEVTWFK